MAHTHLGYCINLVDEDNCRSLLSGLGEEFPDTLRPHADVQLHEFRSRDAEERTICLTSHRPNKHRDTW